MYTLYLYTAYTHTSHPLTQEARFTIAPEMAYGSQGAGESQPAFGSFFPMFRVEFHRKTIGKL